jgi:hypothetical protein
VDEVAIGTQLLPPLWVRPEGGTSVREDGPNLEAADAPEDFDPHADERSWLARVERTIGSSYAISQTG